MTRKQRVLRNYTKYGATKKLAFYQNIHDLMSDEGTSYPDPPEPNTYVAGQAALDLLEKAIQGSLTKAKGTSAILKQAVKACDSIVNGWADYVDSIAQGNVVMINAAGFNATVGETNPKEVPGQIKDYDYELQKAKGTIFLKNETLGVGTTYTHIIGSDLSTLTMIGNFITCTNPAVQLYIVVTTRPEVMVTGLPSNAKLQAACFATNNAGSGELSSIISFSTQ